MLSAAVPSTSKGHSNVAVLLQHVVGNDLLMTNIIGHLTDLEDRLALEQTSTRLRSLSWRAPWRFRFGGAQLRIVFYGISTNVIIQVGSLRVVRPTLTLYERREQNPQSTTQPDSFVCTLNGFADRFASKIRELVIGGTDDIAGLHGRGSHQLIVTSDFLRILNTRFPAVERLFFRDCGFDRGAVEYLNQAGKSLFPRIRHLCLSAVWADGNASAAQLMKLIRPSLTSLDAEYLRVEELGNALVERLTAINLTLNNLDISLANYFRAEGVMFQWFIRSLGRRTNQLTVRLFGENRQPSPAVMAAAQAAVEVPNLVGFYLDHQPVGRHEKYDFDEVIGKLRQLRQLKSLALRGWNEPMTIRELGSVLSCTFSLERLILHNIPPSTRKEDVTSFLRRLPACLEEIEISKAPFDGDHLRILGRQIPAVRCVRLQNVPKVSSHSIEQCFRHWHRLEHFWCDTSLSPPAINNICDARKLRNLEDAEFTMLSDRQPEWIMDQLANAFETVECVKAGTHERLCRVRVRHRRRFPPISPPDLRTIHCDHPPCFHTPKPEYREHSTPSRPRGNGRKKKMDFPDEFSL